MFSFKKKEDPPLILEASIHNLSLTCLKRCVKNNDAFFDGDLKRQTEISNCVSSCVQGYVALRQDVKAMFKDLLDEVDANNEKIWHTYKPENS